MRLEVRDWPCDPAADADELEQARARPAGGPAVIRAGAQGDDHSGGLGSPATVDVVASVHRDEDSAGARFPHEPIRVAQAVRHNAETGAVGSYGQDRGAPPVPLAAGIACRSASEDEATAVVEHVVLLVQSERQTGHEGSCPADGGAP